MQAEAIDQASIEGWWARECPSARLPLTIRPILGGHSNLTFLVRDAHGTSWVLRRPPLGQAAETAHDMAREFRVQRSVQAIIPVPRMVGLALDVLDVPFYVMERVDGVVIRTPQDALVLSPETRQEIGLGLVDTLARLHRVEPESVGLGDFGRPEGYVRRQLRRWPLQWQAVGGRSIPVFDELQSRLAATVPDQQRTAVIHGDFRLDNVMLDARHDVKAVLDWELSTLGDPLADFATMIAYWDDIGAGAPPATSVEGFPNADEVIARYGDESGLDLHQVYWYIAFAHWRLGCIAEGVYARFRDNRMGGSPYSLDVLGAQSTLRAEAALAALEEV
ncbi:phosphotransferase family protein [Nocardioides sp.]|uniref:phosphotransferase family protein n=1 Tax=Nocardioides sp. TaxID=35761 RepID=UPI002611829C|nr:phosphotransferase family protein [Nocardioides sp.]